VVLAVYQIVIPAASPPPVNVTVAVDPARLQSEPQTVAVKGDVLRVDRQIDLGGARLLAALNDGSDRRYEFASLFDGSPATGITLAAGDSELNILVEFGATAPVPVTGITYFPPVSRSGVRPATRLDIMVLPDGRIGAGGGQLYNFTLQTDQGQQSFALPPGLAGKGLWLRVAGEAAGERLAVGDFALTGGAP
jgi:hypothetical protein